MENESVNGYGLDAMPMTVISVRVPLVEKAGLEERARACGQSLSEWARDTLLDTPASRPKPNSLSGPELDQTLEHYLSEGAQQYKHFLQCAEQLFGPLTERMINHRQALKEMLGAFTTEFAKQVSLVTSAIDQQNEKTAALLKARDRAFYRQWGYVCLGVFLLCMVLGTGLGYWRP